VPRKAYQQEHDSQLEQLVPQVAHLQSPMMLTVGSGLGLELGLGILFYILQRRVVVS
jgi:hypothetical protein